MLTDMEPKGEPFKKQEREGGPAANICLERA